MNTATCPDCKHIVSLSAASCPRCGRPGDNNHHVRIQGVDIGFGNWIAQIFTAALASIPALFVLSFLVIVVAATLGVSLLSRY